MKHFSFLQFNLVITQERSMSSIHSFIVTALASTLFSTATFAAPYLSGLGFGAPRVYNILSNPPSYPEKGDTVYDLLNDLFYGYNGSWSAFSALDTWYIDANIGGSDINLGNSAVSSYQGMTDPGLDLIQNTGSASVGIACDGTTDNSVGTTTCSGANEQVGVVVNIPSPGSYETCFDFGHYKSVGTGASIESDFQVVRTGNGSQSISAEGNSRMPSYYYSLTNGDQTSPIYICGLFPISASRKTTFRLFYEQTVNLTAGSIIKGDRATNNGQRDIHISVRKWSN